jgi:serine/threonine protein phosphatase PrpC
LTPGDVLLLCTDGLTKHLSSKEIVDVVSAEQRPELICQVLIEAANEQGGADNISVVVARM